jgi:hypothetical protein
MQMHRKGELMIENRKENRKEKKRKNVHDIIPTK